MNLYKTNAWFVTIVPLIIVIKGLFTSYSSSNLDTSIIILANFLPILLFLIGLALLKTQDKTTPTKVAAITGFISALFWLLSLILSPMLLIVVFLTLILYVATIISLFAVAWYKFKVAGIIGVIIILFAFAIFAGQYGSSLGII